ncbi:PEPxxWA-CTERM sorting domain-containing protein [Azohydromonas aeria]|uniref:PEPxxWA-CTERM sorting domain-containing protein n=1 Tax=Azohydromonas aeria TaxID=2590212 RepID=UPI0012F82E19|nr:PEPxxWA-CTERM sorting domain-containing protein [Azohydromonas aeria]
MLKASWHAAALLALAGPVLPALAAVGSSASLTGLRYELVDLRPGDGIAPSIRFTGATLAESLLLAHWCLGPTFCQRSEGTFTTPAVSNRQYDDGFSGSTSAFAAVSAAGLFAGGQYDNGAGLGYGPYHAEARLRGRRGGNPLFVLSAHTGVRVTAHYTLDAWVIPTPITGPYHDGYGAGAAVFVNSRFIDGPDFFQEVSTGSGFVHDTGELSVLLSNHKDRTATVWGRIGVLADGQVPTGIPEPSTWALLLAGAGLLGGVARRRGIGTAA